MAQQSSRLHRLLTLLDTGSTQATRLAAARQIGDIAKSHPDELPSLLNKVSPYLRSRTWDTRVAAAHAIGAIAESIKHPTIKDLVSYLEAEVLKAGISEAATDLKTVGADFFPSSVDGLSFSSFDVNRVLEFGSPLLASGGQEYDVIVDIGKSPAEKLARQKQHLHRRLGLDVCEPFMDINEMIKDEDLITQKGHPHGNGAHHANRNIQQLVANMVPNFRPKRLSARELNLLKRKAKINAKDQTKGWSEDDDLDGTRSQNPTKSNSTEFISNKLLIDGSAVEDNHENINGRWPFYQFVEQLIHDVFDPIWETRHGATMALREVLTRQAGCAGVQMPNLFLETSGVNDVSDGTRKRKRSRDFDLNSQTEVVEEPVCKQIKSEETEISCSSLAPSNIGVEPIPQELDPSLGASNSKFEKDDATKIFPFEDGNSSSKMVSLADLHENCKLKKLINSARHSSINNWIFLQDCAVRFLCVLTLDRFGDFISDQVVAPVRETCAQALGAVLKYMHPSLVHETLNILLQMQNRQEWEVRHGGLLGVKYLIAVRPDMLQDLLIYILPSCKAGLGDSDDDVRAVAAEALIPAAAALVRLDGETLHSVVMLLWDILLDLDDLSPSTSSVMNLLAEIYSQPEMVPEMLVSATQCVNELDLHEVFGNDDGGERIKHGQSPYILSDLTPRLWPFMRHNITSVRHSAIRTLERLLEVCYRKSFDPEAGSFWATSVLGDMLRIVFQNLLLESDEEILQCSLRVWRLLVQCSKHDLEVAAESYFSSWVDLATTPSGSAFNVSKMFLPAALPRKSHFKAAAKMRAVKLENDYCGNFSIDTAKENLFRDSKDDFSTSFRTNITIGMDNEKSVMRMRVITSTALGILASKLAFNSLQIVLDPLRNSLASLFGFRRLVVAMVLISWFQECRNGDHFEENIRQTVVSNPIRHLLLELLACTDPAFPTKDSSLPYAELSRTYKKMRNEASKLVRVIESSDCFPEFSFMGNIETLSIENAIDLSKLALPTEISNCNLSDPQRSVDDVESSRQQLLSTACYLNCLQANLHISVTALFAAAVVWMSELPSKLNPIILPLMTSIRREREEILQEKAAEALAQLVFDCVGRKPCPNDKLVTNLLSLSCMDHSVTPQVSAIASSDDIEEHDLLSFGVSSGNPKLKIHVPGTNEERSRSEGFISRRGSEFALMHICLKFGSLLFDKLPKLWERLTDVLKPVCTESQSPADDLQMTCMVDNYRDSQRLINNIQAVQSISPVIDETLKPRILSLLPCIICCIFHHHVAVRLAASRCVASMAMSMTTSIMISVIRKVLPMLRDSGSVHARQGAGMLLSLLVQALGMDLVPYSPLLAVPLLRCMGDSDHTVRQSVTHSFAALVPLLSLARGVHPPTELGDYYSKNTEDARFLEQLLDNSHIDDYKLPISLKVEMRRYQQEGINWLSFLKRFKLHGILCDDMGLGKTLQASAIVACDIVDRRACGKEKDISSLIICPSTLVGHWAYEIDKYIDDSVMITLQYIGSVQERMALRKNFDKYNVIITSYDVIRKDIDFFEKLSWNYCILDEGHIIKNSKSKVTCAVKQLKAEHRLILSGTPIQNNVLELWSLFDFLMPGFLGTERQFQATYGKPLTVAKDSKCSAKDAEAGVLAMEALHKQVMPFLLRRTKDEVLSDLPEKIIQDRYCDLSPLQLKLYEQFSSSNAKKEISDLVKGNDINSTDSVSPSMTTSHVFQALQYLLKLCSHPLLVLSERPADSHMSVLAEILPNSLDVIKELHEIQHSPKLVALQEILEECGIGQEAAVSEGITVAGQHRVLIFAQHRAFLDIVERDLFQAHMKSVTFLRLDGSVDPNKRFDIVKTFNSDPTIDALLLTTHVGGLGLNLTSADTLVFLEHDWNPMKDLQAMDRAHRLGQRKVVNVHRLIMRGTLEEKVMSLQKFKVSVANAVINADNASLKTMNTDQLLDLFTPAHLTRKVVLANTEAKAEEEFVSAGGKKGMSAVLRGLGELWDHSQYTEEFDLSGFLAKLND